MISDHIHLASMELEIYNIFWNVFDINEVRSYLELNSKRPIHKYSYTAKKIRWISYQHNTEKSTLNNLQQIQTELRESKKDFKLLQNIHNSRKQSIINISTEETIISTTPYGVHMMYNGLIPKSLYKILMPRKEREIFRNTLKKCLYMVKEITRWKISSNLLQQMGSELFTGTSKRASKEAQISNVQNWIQPNQIE